eukprot:692441-Prymnesium_polylepis.1
MQSSVTLRGTGTRHEVAGSHPGGIGTARTIGAASARAHSATAVEDHTGHKAMPGRNRDAGWSHDHPAR